MDIGYALVFVDLKSRHWFLRGMNSMYKKKLQNEATCVRPLHLPLLTAAALYSPHFLLCTKTSHLPYWIQLSSASFIGRPRHSLPSRFMPALHLSIIYSSFAICTARQMSSPMTEGPPPAIYFALSLVILAATIFRCAVLYWEYVLPANQTGRNTRWISTDLIFRSADILSVLTAIRLVIFSRLLLRNPRQSDRKVFLDVLQALLVLIAKVHICYEVLHLKRYPSTLMLMLCSPKSCES
jgi:hypothetical protein